MKIIKTKSISPKEALAGIRKIMRKAEKAGREGNHGGRLDKDTRYKLELVATEMDNLSAIQEIITQHYAKGQEKKEIKKSGK